VIKNIVFAKSGRKYPTMLYRNILKDK